MADGLNVREILVDVDEVKEIKEFIDRHPKNKSMILNEIKKSEYPITLYIHDNAEKYMKTASRSIKEGFVVTLDMGDETPKESIRRMNDLKKRFKSESAIPVRNIDTSPGTLDKHGNPYKGFSQNDICIASIFSFLEEAGERYGLKTEYLTLQKEMKHAKGLEFPEDFRVLVQRKLRKTKRK